MTTATETTGLSILEAIASGDLAAPAKAKAKKAAKPAKAAKAAKPAKAKAEKPAAAPKAAKAAKPRKDKPMTETTPAVDPIEVFFAEFIASDTRSDTYMRDLLSRVYEAGKSAKKARAPRAGGPSKNQLAAELLLRPEGATSKDILDLTQWPAVSVPAVARSAGLTLRQEKEGRVTRYFGTKAAA
jgi:hypothetical protein